MTQDSYAPCKDPAVKAKLARANAMLAMGGTLNPITQASHANFAAATKQRFVVIELDSWSLPPGWFTHQLHAYGIPTDLKDLQYKCDSGIGIFIHSSIIVPVRQVWMADRTLRALSCHQGFRVTSRAIFDKRRGSSLDSGMTGKIWKPWGVGARSKSFGMALSRGIAAGVGNGDKTVMNNLMALRELSDQRRAEFEEARVEGSSEQTGSTKRKPRSSPSRMTHRHITIEPKRKKRRSSKSKRRVVASRERGSHRGAHRRR